MVQPIEIDSRALVIGIPAWVDEMVLATTGALETDEARMELVIRLAHRNVEEGGGPFAAVVFDGAGPIAAGVNRVLDSGFSIAHAEIVALMRSQQAARLAPERAASPSALVTSTEPCCQCFGATVWSSVTSLICGATTADAEAIGFDEGPKPAGWPATLEKRGIAVRLGVLRDEAKTVLAEYARRGGPIYGLRHPTTP